MGKNQESRDFLTINALNRLVSHADSKSLNLNKVHLMYLFMNINMTDAVFINALGEKHKFDNFFIKDRNIRYVHIPEQVPIISAIEKQMGKLINPGRGKGKRGQGRGPAEQSAKAHRAYRNQKETLALINKLRQGRVKEPGEVGQKEDSQV